MADLPIHFSGPMVLALLDGRKSQTRRALSPKWSIDGYPWKRMAASLDWETAEPRSQASLTQAIMGNDAPPDAHLRVRKSNGSTDPDDWTYHRVRPPIRLGDRLWVREAWRTPESLDHLSPSQIGAQCLEAGYRGMWCPRVTVADNVAHQWSDEDGFSNDEKAGRLRAAMHMPRWASRLTLTVTDVRVQRLQDITEEDARAEGMKAGDWPDRPECDCDDDDCVACSHYPALHKPAFRHLWDSLNAKRDFGWNQNPWVVALTFTVHRGNIDALAANV